METIQQESSTVQFTGCNNTNTISTASCSTSNVENLVCNAAVQTEVTSAMMDDEEKKHMENDLEIETLQSELQSLVSVPPFSEQELEQDDDRVKFYTGLPNYKYY